MHPTSLLWWKRENVWAVCWCSSGQWKVPESCLYKQHQLNGHDCGVEPYRGGNRVGIVVFKAWQIFRSKYIQCLAAYGLYDEILFSRLQCEKLPYWIQINTWPPNWPPIGHLRCAERFLKVNYSWKSERFLSVLQELTALWGHHFP